MTKRVIITGAASGFGKGSAESLRRRGAQVVGLDLVPTEDVIACDIRDQAQVDAAVNEAVARMGGLDVLVNNAGIGGPADAGAPPDDRAVATIDTNLLGAWRVTGSAMPALLQTKGRVVNVASGLAQVNVPFGAAYIASKRGLAGYSDVLRLEYGDRITVTTVYPGYVATPIHDVSEAMGISLGDVVPHEPIGAVIKTIVEAALGKPKRDVATTRATGVGLFFGRHFPVTTDRVVTWRFRRLAAKGAFDDAPSGSNLT
jgi:NAD(P)-dependent dehydrogenase (short-subunit alcohol dehydrogenase family)